MDYLFSERIGKILFLAIIGYPAIYLLAFFLEKTIKKHYTSHSAKLLRKTVLYLGMSILTIDLLRDMDFKLTALMGSAGIAGMAIGFAFKTSISNIISGLFIAFESPFSIGDYIQVGDVRGTALSFDLLAIKISSSDNNFIRVPNEQLIKTSVINYTRFDTHRVDIPLSIAYKDNLQRAEQVLLDIVADDPIFLSDPKPLFRFECFGDSSINLTLCVWSKGKNYRKAKNLLAQRIVSTFDQHSLSMPYPRVVIDQSEPAAPPSGK